MSFLGLSETPNQQLLLEMLCVRLMSVGPPAYFLFEACSSKQEGSKAVWLRPLVLNLWMPPAPNRK